MDGAEKKKVEDEILLLIQTLPQVLCCNENVQSMAMNYSCSGCQ